MKVENLITWDNVRDYIDQSELYISPSYLDRVNSRKYPQDAFTLGQLASKAWLVDHCYLAGNNVTNVAILGNWIGAIVEPLLYHMSSVKKVYGIDIDSDAVRMGDEFNNRLVQDNWRYKGVVADASLLNCADMDLEVDGQLINFIPEVIINTSCEHMSNEWFDTVSKDQLLIIQSNDSTLFNGHINACDNISDMYQKYPMSNILFSGELRTPIYTRYMMIGYK